MLTDSKLARGSPRQASRTGGRGRVGEAEQRGRTKRATAEQRGRTASCGPVRAEPGAGLGERRLLRARSRRARRWPRRAAAAAGRFAPSQALASASGGCCGPVRAEPGTALATGDCRPEPSQAPPSATSGCGPYGCRPVGVALGELQLRLLFPSFPPSRYSAGGARLAAGPHERGHRPGQLWPPPPSPNARSPATPPPPPLLVCSSRGGGAALPGGGAIGWRSAGLPSSRSYTSEKRTNRDEQLLIRCVKPAVVGSQGAKMQSSGAAGKKKMGGQWTGGREPLGGVT